MAGATLPQTVLGFQISETPLHPACKEGLLPVVQTMCAYGCQVDLVNKVQQLITYHIGGGVMVENRVEGVCVDSSLDHQAL